MTVASIMTTPPVTVTMDDSLAAIRQIFAETRFHHLLVVESHRLLGIISDRDLLKALSPHLGTAQESRRDAAALHKKAHQIMSRKPLVVGQWQGIAAALELFHNNTISCLPVVAEDGAPVGILSWRDLFRAIRVTP